ncbi:hypothetical protein ACFYZT_27505 [Streptomyces sp. NPDC001591]|uniref:hypothetical protein n=1 Tax=Streptomyces sp. NPDC001591 TaxID=3364589 RepID=UPI003682803F
MGIESDHLVYAYLSRVGDLAQQRQLPSGERMRLVAGLRDEIDRRRARFEPETPEAVRAVLDRLGTPEEVLDAVGRTAGPEAAAAPGPAPVSVPEQRGSRRWRAGSRPDPAPPPQPQNVPPHLAGLDELGPSSSDHGEPDWWRMPAAGRGPQVEGFAGGIEIPELFGPPDEEEEPPAAAPPPAPPGGLLRHLRQRRKRRKEEAAAGDPAQGQPARTARPRPHGLLVLAALLLAAGALTGYWPLLGAGALAAYVSRALGPRERKWVVLGVPAAVFTAAVLWLWGRSTGRWGEPLPAEQVGPAFQSMWPALARTAGGVLAVCLAWRSRRT